MSEASKGSDAAISMWYLLPDELVLHIFCFVPDAALPTVTRLDTLCHGFVRERLSSLKRLTEKPFYMRKSDVFKYALNFVCKKLNNADALVLATALCNALCNGALASLEWLSLNHNAIGDAGLQALADALSSGALLSLLKLDLSMNKISDAGVSALADAVGSGALPKCTFVDVGNNPASEEAGQALEDALEQR